MQVRGHRRTLRYNIINMPTLPTRARGVRLSFSHTGTGGRLANMDADAPALAVLHDLVTAMANQLERSKGVEDAASLRSAEAVLAEALCRPTDLAEALQDVRDAVEDMLVVVLRHTM